MTRHESTETIDSLDFGASAPFAWGSSDGSPVSRSSDGLSSTRRAVYAQFTRTNESNMSGSAQTPVSVTNNFRIELDSPLTKSLEVEYLTRSQIG